jgi:hypothetical protein
MHVHCTSIRSIRSISPDSDVHGGWIGAGELVGGELGAFPGLAEAPAVADGVAGGDGAAVVGGDEERQGAGELLLDGPERAPVAVHGVPGRRGRLDLHLDDVSRAADVVDEDHEEPGVAAQGEAHAALALAHDTAVVDGRHAAHLPGQREERRHGQVEVVLGRVAPPVRRPRRAQVRRRHHDRARVAVAPVLRRPRLLDPLALDLVARPARRPSCKQRRAQRRGHVPVPQRHRVLVPARPRLRPPSIRRAIKRYVPVTLPRRVQRPITQRRHHRRQHHHHHHCKLHPALRLVS